MFNSPMVRVFIEHGGYLDPKQFVMTPSDVPLVLVKDDSGAEGYQYLPSHEQYFVERFVNLTENFGGLDRKIFEGDIVCVKGSDPFDTLDVFYGEVIVEDGSAKVLEIGGDDRINIFEDNFFRDFQIVGNVHGAKYLYY